MNFRNCIREIPDFPKEGINFKDITPILKKPEAFQDMINELYEGVKEMDFDYIAAIEARGFLVGTPLALKLNKGFIPIRKKGKLPGEIVQAEYDLEYGSNTIEMQSDAFEPGSKILIMDDLLATGGTVSAAIELVERLKGKVVGFAFLMELDFLKGRDKFDKSLPVVTLIKE